MQRPAYKLATFERRLSAKGLDIGVGTLFVMVCGMLIDFVGIDGVWIMLALLLTVAYWLFGDAMNGQSVRKRLLGLKVVDYKHGYACTPFQTLTRNIAGCGFGKLPRRRVPLNPALSPARLLLMCGRTSKLAPPATILDRPLRPLPSGPANPSIWRVSEHSFKAGVRRMTDEEQTQKGRFADSRVTCLPAMPIFRAELTNASAQKSRKGRQAIAHNLPSCRVGAPPHQVPEGRRIARTVMRDCHRISSSHLRIVLQHPFLKRILCLRSMMMNSSRKDRVR